MIACGQGAAQMNIGKGDVENYVLPYSSNGNNILFAAKILHSYDECIINAVSYTHLNVPTRKCRTWD